MLKPALATTAALLALAAPAQAAPKRTLATDVAVTKFVVKDGRAFAQATATTTVRTKDGKARREQTKLLLQTSGGSSCRILTLRLDDLQLRLLGLNLNTSAINVRITGRQSQALGRLFCRLASGVRLPSATRTLNRRLAGKPMRVLGVRATLPSERRFAQQQQTPQQPPQCNVLRLVLGPLNLDLLGLVVDLYGEDASKPVIVEVTATPGGGVLGDLFCQLANSGVTLRPPANR
jgi:hypothetical protein